MRRTLVLIMLAATLAACGGPTSADNCTELQRYVVVEYGPDAGRDDIGEERALEIARHADELAGEALAVGADREWALCYDVVAQVLSNVVSEEFENICETLNPDEDC